MNGTFDRPVHSFDFPIGSGPVRGDTSVFYAMLCQVGCELGRDELWTVVCRNTRWVTKHSERLGDAFDD